MLKCSNVKITERGVSLYLAIIVMAVILGIALGISAILLAQIKMIRGMGDSVVALYAADTGIERVLKEGASASGVLDNGASYTATKINAGNPGCSSPPASFYCIKSVGTYKGTRRAIEVIR